MDAMKPHIFSKDGEWYCGDGKAWVIAHTIDEAYQRWIGLPTDNTRMFYVSAVSTWIN